MIISMTGYGKTACEFKNRTVTIELKSLNSKQTDIYTKLPALYKEKEMEIRTLLANMLKRGKIECSITVDMLNGEQAALINKSVVKSYFQQLKDLQKELNFETNEQILATLLRLPDALKTDKENLDEAEWKQVEKKLTEAIKLTEQYRFQEGKSLEKDFKERIRNIENNLKAIDKFEKTRTERIMERLKNSLNEFFPEAEIDKNRFEQELIYYLEKLDITEEKVRLKNHCDYFKEVMKDENQAGKKLTFISQELGREINTIGSKANDFEIQKLVVLMKDELEKIKEQLMNIL